MNRRDLVANEKHYASTLRREAASRRKRYPAVAEQLDRWAEAADRRVEAIRCGPLFDGEGA
jgi:hypothetical protein